MNKSISLSVRIPEEDANFLAGLSIEGAVTPSDKLRAVIRDARIRAAMTQSYAEALAQANDTLKPVGLAIREAENVSGQHSEVLEKFLPWLAEAFALTVSSRTPKPSDQENAMQALEAAVANRIFRLFEFTLRIAATEVGPCYDKTLMSRGIAGAADVLKLVHHRLEEKKNG
jgi:hypothetical protein